MSFRMLVLSMVTLLLLLQQVAAICNVCGSKHACVSPTEFQLCFNGVRDTSTTFKCQNLNEICTATSIICVNSELAPSARPACGDTSVCGNCEGVDDGAYTCTSRTTFNMCMNGKMTTVRPRCPPGYLCDTAKANMRGENPCVEQCEEANATLCDTDVPVDGPPPTEPPVTTTEPPTEPPVTTTEPPTSTITTTTTEPDTPPPTSTVDPAFAICEGRTVAGRYRLPDDNTCTSFAFCFWYGGQLKGIRYDCPAGLYFNSESTLCEAMKPLNCD